ncbi:hypothetical protein SAMN05892883_4255 [Jatrophihabitans sp. GAS493]|uniref:hypothetical protein n=1 Tax=Jatrophihabitans sp. GAS493 TaxID=1907575 RepID=UPI000BB92181|nr:hypothetical protein [Jatrophihabitans sp. GAS493]SOD75053.1 hypothetical protein SAMN05892883_4255 [Jatrophihabitans sp. GAS493]
MMLVDAAGGLDVKSPQPWSAIAGLAGRIPDDQLLRTRMAIGDGCPRAALAEIAEAVEAERLAITNAERSNFSRLARMYGVDPTPFDAAHPAACDSTDYCFVAPNLHDSWRDAGDDLAVLAAAGATVTRGTAPAETQSLMLPDGLLRVRALWRVTRLSPHPAAGVSDVRLIQLRRDADPIAATMAATNALRRHGDHLPAVEVFGEGEMLTRYQLSAMECAVAIWTAG